MQEPEKGNGKRNKEEIAKIVKHHFFIVPQNDYKEWRNVVVVFVACGCVFIICLLPPIDLPTQTNTQLDHL